MKTTMRSERARNGGMRKKSPSTETPFAMAMPSGAGRGGVHAWHEAPKCRFASLEKKRERGRVGDLEHLHQLEAAQDARDPAREGRGVSD